MSYSKINLKKNEEHRIRKGHLWVFSNEIKSIDGEADNGDIVNLYDYKEDLLGAGFYNRNSLIAVRLLEKSFGGNIRDYFKTKILKAFGLRQEIYPNRNSYRLAFSESDFIPGLIIDKYNDTYVLQISSYGMQKNINHVVEVLKDELKAKNIFSRNENHFRKLEGLPEGDEVYFGDVSKEIIDDGKVKYEIDFNNSQKTGFYFDQCDNREFIEKIARGKTVLDAFCNVGGFGLYAAFAGAKSVTFVDSSKQAIAQTKENISLNGFEEKNFELFAEDVFDYLKKCIDENKKFDIVMIDPPAFAKNKKLLSTAIKGYEKLNRMALSVVSEKGFLVTSSCSHHVTKEKFIELISAASQKANKTIQQIHFNEASLDHPQLPAMPETSYLKFAVFKII